MKTGKSLVILSVMAIVSFFCSFTSPAGGEGFEIYLDNKLVIQQFNQDMKNLKNLPLNASNAKSELKVKFYHCGMIGKNRSLSLKDAKNTVLKQWQFNNETGKNFAISIPVGEVLALQRKAGNPTLYLYYSSKEVSGGRLLAGITSTDKKPAVAK